MFRLLVFYALAGSRVHELPAELSGNRHEDEVEQVGLHPPGILGEVVSVGRHQVGLHPSTALRVCMFNVGAHHGWHPADHDIPLVPVCRLTVDERSELLTGGPRLEPSDQLSLGVAPEVFVEGQRFHVPIGDSTYRHGETLRTQGELEQTSCRNDRQLGEFFAEPSQLGKHSRGGLDFVNEQQRFAGVEVPPGQ